MDHLILTRVNREILVEILPCANKCQILQQLRSYKKYMTKFIVMVYLKFMSAWTLIELSFETL